jgi:hypothetical protein
MSRTPPFVLTAFLLGALSLALSAGAVTAPSADGLVTVPSRSLDEVAVRPDANFQGYRKVVIDPVQVEIRKGWLRSINATRGPSRWLVPEDAANIAETAATGLTDAVVAAFTSRGYEIVAAPEAGALRVSAKVTDLAVNAPDVESASLQALYNVTAGEATLTLELRDAGTGALLARVVDRGTARELSTRVNRVFGVTNVFWFDALFRQWTASSIREFEAARLVR